MDDESITLYIIWMASFSVYWSNVFVHEIYFRCYVFLCTRPKCQPPDLRDLLQMILSLILKSKWKSCNDRIVNPDILIFIRTASSVCEFSFALRNPGSVEFSFALRNPGSNLTVWFTIETKYGEWVVRCPTRTVVQYSADEKIDMNVQDEFGISRYFVYV